MINKILRGKIRAIPIVVALFIAVSAVLTGCAAAEEKGMKYLGSFLSSDVYLYLDENVSSAEFSSIKKKCEDKIDEYEDAFSLSSFGALTAFNSSKSGQKTEVSPLCYNLFKRAVEISEETCGAFDPTVYPLVDLWGFSFRFDGEYRPTEPYDRERSPDGALLLPDEKYVSAFRSLVGVDGVSLFFEDGRYYLTKSDGVTVDGVTYERRADLSSIAKGSLSDQLKAIIEDSSITRYYISLGTSSLYLGERSGGGWSVQFVDPKSSSRASFGEAEIKKKSVSTSGVYEKNYVSEGVSVHHVLDGATGRSADTDLKSAIVIGDDGDRCDALSTALIVMGADGAKEFMKNVFGYDFILVTDNDIFSTIELKNVVGGYAVHRL